MKYNEFKENEIYYTRVSHIRCFKRHFPEVDSSKIVSFRVIVAPNTESSALRIDLYPFEGQRHLNPRSECGYWYIEPWNFNNICHSCAETAIMDPVEWKYFIEYTYEDFPDSHYCMEVSKQEWLDNHLKKGSYILVSSSTKPYRLARILSAVSRADAPYDVQMSRKHLLSNTDIASAIYKAMHNNRKAEAKAMYPKQVHKVDLDDINKTIISLTNRIDILEQNNNQLKNHNVDKIKELSQKNANLEDLVCQLERELQLYRFINKK